MPNDILKGGKCAISLTPPFLKVVVVLVWHYLFRFAYERLFRLAPPLPNAYGIWKKVVLDRFNTHCM